MNEWKKDKLVPHIHDPPYIFFSTYLHTKHRSLNWTHSRSTDRINVRSVRANDHTPISPIRSAARDAAAALRAPLLLNLLMKPRRGGRKAHFSCLHKCEKKCSVRDTQLAVDSRTHVSVIVPRSEWDWITVVVCWNQEQRLTLVGDHQRQWRLFPHPVDSRCSVWETHARVGSWRRISWSRRSCCQPQPHYDSSCSVLRVGETARTLTSRVTVICGWVIAVRISCHFDCGQCVNWQWSGIIEWLNEENVHNSSPPLCGVWSVDYKS